MHNAPLCFHSSLTVNTGAACVATHTHRLNETQKVGLQFVQEFERRIPRAEVTQLEAFVQKEAKALVMFSSPYPARPICENMHGPPTHSLHSTQQDPHITCMVCGSYRRGHPDSGDIDILMTHPNHTKASKGELSSTQTLMRTHPASEPTLLCVLQPEQQQTPSY